MKINFRDIQNQFFETIQNNKTTFGLLSAVLILYHNPSLYFTILGVGTTYGLFKQFNYELNVDFKMNKIKNIEFVEKDNINVEKENINDLDNDLDTDLDTELDNKIDKLDEFDIKDKLEDLDDDTDSDDSISELRKSIFLKKNENLPETNKFDNICAGEYFTDNNHPNKE
jgi:hypothetical protein